MRRVLIYGLLAVWVGGILAAQPALAQKRGSDQGAKKRGAKSDPKRNRGANQNRNQKSSKRKQAEKLTPLQQLGKAMQKELGLSHDQTENIRKVIKQFQSTRKEGSADDRKVQRDALRDIDKELKKANKDRDHDRVRELMDQKRTLQRESKQAAEELDPKLLDAMAKELSAQQEPRFWDIVKRLEEKSNGDPMARYLELLNSVDLSTEQERAVGQRYKKFLAEYGKIDKGDRKAIQEVEKRFQDDVLAELSDEQRSSFQKAIKKHDRRAQQSQAKSKKGGGKNARSGDKGGKNAKGAKAKAKGKSGKR